MSVVSVARRFTGHRYTSLLALGIIVCSVVFFLQLENSTYLKGPDAYYYALQADYWATTGDVKIPDSSPIHRIVGSLQKFGLKTETSIHLWISLALALLYILTLYFARPLSKVAKLVITTCLLLSPGLLFVAIEFPKFFLFLLCLPVALILARLPAPKNLYALIPLLIAVVLHRAAVPIAGLIVVILLLQNFKSVIFNRVGVIVLISGSMVLLSLFLLVGDRFSFLDLERLGGFNNLSPGIITLLGRDALPLVIKLEIIALLICLVLAIIFHVRQHKKFCWQYAVIFALILPGFFPFSNTEVFGVGERYAILLPFLFGLSIILLLPELTMPAQIEPEQTEPTTLKPAFYLGGLFIIAFALPFRIDYSHPNYLDPDYQTYDTVTKAVKNENIPMLIVHRGLNFYYKFKTRKESFHYEPEAHWDKTRVWRLAHKISADELNYYLQPPCDWSNSYIKSTGHKDYFLIREDCWFALRAQITEEKDQDLYARTWQWWKNPAENRPAFLYRKHRQSGQEQDDEFSTFKRND